MSSLDGERGRFRTTHWSVVVAATSRDETSRRAALEDLCAAYWYPLYAFVRRSGFDAHAAADLTQEFFARILARDDLRRVDRERGRFRTFVLAAMKNMLVNHREAARALKRGGGHDLVSIDADDAEVRFASEPADERTPEAAFERVWAEAVIARALERLRAEQTKIGRVSLFDDLVPALSDASEALPHATIAARHTLSENAVKVTVHRLRKRLGELLRDEVSATLERPEDTDLEIRDLFRAFGRASPAVDGDTPART